MSSEPESDSDHFKNAITSALQNVHDLRAEAKRDHVLEALLRGDPSGLPAPGATLPLGDSDSGETGVRPRRRVFREWPRDPSGIAFDPSICEGKSAPNGTGLWGATLYDFYHVTVDPAAADDTRKNRVISTGSRLSNWAEKVGETKLVEEEMTWANQEEGPKIRLAADIISNICDLDWRLTFGTSGKKEQDRKDLQNPTDPFTSPPSWPLVPFSYRKPMLQSPIPLHLLPQVLIVHDPWGLIHGKIIDGPRGSFNWSDVPDITYTYKLRLSEKGQEIISESRQAAEALAGTPSPRVLFTITAKAKDPNDVPAPILVSVPPPPCLPTQTPSAHLYLTPSGRWGEGHRSLVYDAEWDVPRSILSVSDDSQAHVAKICHECVTEAARKILDEKEAKRQAILHAYHGRKRSRAARASSDSDSDEDVIIVGPLRTKLEYVKQVTPAASIDISRCTTLLDPPSVPSSSATKLPDETRRVYTVKPETTTTVETWKGHVTEIHVDNVPWFLPGEKVPNCPHSHRLVGPGHLSHPSPTAPVRVTAKISRTGGRHLSQEASNYENLPRFMSEHWTGFNVVPPLENPTPLGAIIPNYFGYYVRVREDGSLEDENCVPPKDEDDDAIDVDSEEKEVPREEYFSSILLTENCGLRVDLFQKELDASHDEREECAALLFRLHHLGWVLGACHVGKFLAQFGDHADWPIFKSQKDRRYRISGLSHAWSRQDALASGKLEEWEMWRQQEVELCAKMLNIEFPGRP